jgi:hypothetical protein
VLPKAGANAAGGKIMNDTLILAMSNISMHESMLYLFIQQIPIGSWGLQLFIAYQELIIFNKDLNGIF